jgi:hypothetical protein
MLAENLPIIWPNEKTVKLQVFASIEGSHGHPLSKFTIKYKPVKRVYQTLRSVYLIFFLQSLQVCQRNFKSEMFITAAFDPDYF